MLGVFYPVKMVHSEKQKHTHTGTGTHTATHWSQALGHLLNDILAEAKSCLRETDHLHLLAGNKGQLGCS